jgi:hypothetical protein
MTARFARGAGELGQLLRERQDAIEAWQANDRLLTEVLAGEGSRERETRLRGELERLDRQIRTFEKQLEQSFPDYVTLTQPRPVAAADARGLLRAGEGLFLQLTADERSYMFFVRPEGVRVARTDLGRGALGAGVAALRAGLEVREEGADGLRKLAPFDVEAAHRLYRDLFGPFEAELRETDHVFMVLDGAMQNLSPAVLLVREAPAPTETYGRFRDLKQESFEVFRELDFLGRQIGFSVLPSVSALKGLRSVMAAARAPDPFVGFGDPALGGAPVRNRGIVPDDVFRVGTTLDLRSLREALGPLPASGEELRALAAALGADENALFLGPEATEDRVKSMDLSAYRVIAFATHGLLAGEFTGVAEPALVLTIPEPATAREDGVLTASEVAALRVNADWVILSACNTAAPAGRPGAEGLSGLAHAFFYAASRALLVSHWWVDSDAAARLTTNLFASFADRPELTRGEALRISMDGFFAPDAPLKLQPSAVLGSICCGG